MTEKTFKNEEKKDFSFSKQQHLLSPKDFEKVYLNRCFVYNDTMKVFCVSNQKSFSRLGLSVSKKVGNAVTRNRWKRLIREAFRIQQDHLPLGIDLVIVPKRCCPLPEFTQIVESLRDLIWWAERKNRKRLRESNRS